MTTPLDSSHQINSYAVFCFRETTPRVKLDVPIAPPATTLTLLSDAVPVLVSFFFFNDTATTEIYTLSLHDALPIYEVDVARPLRLPSTCSPVAGAAVPN